MSKHTPGPWQLETVPTSAGICHKIGSFPGRNDDRPSAACVYVDGIRPGLDELLPHAQELLANARLIAAAPEMLEALRPLANYLAILETMGGPSGGKGMTGDDHLWHVSSSAGEAVITFGDLQRARAAIAKAEGKQ